uniref:Transposase n=1 Tax=Heterorhabditis bacteriophora TaxID=37862 RepID=A0A1I7XIV6_HETBA
MLVGQLYAHNRQFFSIKDLKKITPEVWVMIDSDILNNLSMDKMERIFLMIKTCTYLTAMGIEKWLWQAKTLESHKRKEWHRRWTQMSHHGLTLATGHEVLWICAK